MLKKLSIISLALLSGLVHAQTTKPDAELNAIAAKMKLRHMPLLIVREMARHEGHKALVSRLLPDVIKRADELSEFLAIYWKDGKTPISAQVKKGLARAFNKFGEYALAKYNRDGAVKLRLYVPEAGLSSIAPGTVLNVNCDGCAGATATVTYVSDAPEFTPPVIYSLQNRQKLLYLVEARPDAGTRALNPGQIVDVDLSR